MTDPEEQQITQWLPPVVAVVLMLVGGTVANVHAGMTGTLAVFALSFAILSVWARMMAFERRSGA